MALFGIQKKKRMYYRLIKVLGAKKNLTPSEKHLLNACNRKHRHCCKRIIFLNEQKLNKKKVK